MLGNKLKYLRKLKHLTQLQVANKIGVSKGCISNWENENTVPSVEQLRKLAIFLDVKCDYLLDLELKLSLNTKNLNDVQIIAIQNIIDIMNTEILKERRRK